MPSNEFVMLFRTCLGSSSYLVAGHCEYDSRQGQSAAAYALAELIKSLCATGRQRSLPGRAQEHADRRPGAEETSVCLSFMQGRLAKLMADTST